MKDSRELLREFARDGSEGSFRELVSRYVGLVHATAARQVGGDAHLAEDICQMVFSDLARKCRDLPADVMLGGWLHRHTCNVARTVRRGQIRRLVREREAAVMNEPDDRSGGRMEELGPVLDEEVHRLGAADRAAITLRYFEQLDFGAVGRALGTGEDAARMRVNRALERLRGRLARRGLSLTTAGLGAALAGSSISAVPAGLVASISAQALAVSSIGSVSASGMLYGIMTTTAKVKTAVVVVAMAGMLAQIGWEERQRGALNRELDAMSVDLEKLRTENDRLKADAARASALASKSVEEHSELMRLRAELQGLRGPAARSPRPKAPPNAVAAAPAEPAQPATPADTPLPRASWTFAGYSTPEKALESVAWAMREGNLKVYLDSMTPDAREHAAEELGDKTEEEAQQLLSREAMAVSALRFERKEVQPDGQVSFTVRSESVDDGNTKMVSNAVLKFVQVNGEWRYSP